MTFLSHMPLLDENQVKTGWSLINRPVIWRLLEADMGADHEAIAAEIRRIKDRLQYAAVEFGLGLFPES